MAERGMMEIDEGVVLRKPDELKKDTDSKDTMSGNTYISGDCIYEDASSGLVYTLDDISVGDSSTDDVYSDCVSTVLERESPVSEYGNDGEGAEGKNTAEEKSSNTSSPGEGQESNPVYFELEKVCDDSVPKHTVQEIAQTFEAMSDKERTPVPEMSPTEGFEDNFQPVIMDTAPVEDPFKNFDDVEKSVPVYELAKSTDDCPAGTSVDNKAGDDAVSDSTKSGTGVTGVHDPIYDAVPARDPTDSGNAYMSLLGDPIYDVVHSSDGTAERQDPGSSGSTATVSNTGLGLVYSIAQEAVKKSLNPPSNLSKSLVTSSMYDMAKPLSSNGSFNRNDHEFLTESHPPRYPSCKQGAGRPVSVHFLDRAEEVRRSLRSVPRAYEDGDYDKLKFKKLNSKKAKSRSQFYVGIPLEEEGVTSPIELSPTELSPEINHQEGSISSDRLYESISVSTTNLSDDGWGSSEFESDDDDVLVENNEAPDKPLPPEPKQNKLSDDVVAGGARIIGRIRSLRRKNEFEVDDDIRCFPVDLNLSKHPPPELPPPPDNLSESQKKRRCVVELTISSEKSYINSLERITEDYEKIILENVGGPRSQVRVVFKEAHQLLSHHKMFQIELADRARKWDQDEKIGDIFTASFSKTMLIDAYSTYVNGFAAAMDEIKSVQRSRPLFDEQLRAKEAHSSDRLSIFGLMVKPVQRFPQFIMLLQDLLKYTPQDHHDRGALQLALTELENFTHKLNERKRHSEQQFSARQINSQLSKQLSQVLVRTADQPKRLLRQDDLEQVVQTECLICQTLSGSIQPPEVGETGNMKSKKVRIFLMNDSIMCVKVGVKEQGGFKTERYKLKWMTSIHNMELKDSAITPDMESIIKGGPGKLSIYSTQIDKPEEDPFHLFADVNEMLHDYPILAQISGLIQTLKRSYYGLTEELIHEHTRDLQRLIQMKDEQLRLVNSCSIILSDNARNERTRYVFQTPTPAVKHDWCMDFLIAKLAIDKQNNPAWDASSSDDQDLPPAFFMKCVPVDIPRHYTKMKCAIPVFLASSSGTRLGIQHLWVVTTTPTRGQISIISIHNSKPSLTESFKAADVEVMCTVHVPGFSMEEKEFTFAEDTVWLGTINNEILIFLLTSKDGMRREATATVSLPAAPVSMKYIDERIFCSLLNGQLAVFTRDDNGTWDVTTPRILNLGKSVITCMKIVDDSIWVALATKLLVLDIDSLKEKAVHNLGVETEGLIINDFVTSGVGIWVSFKESSKLRLYHFETLENLQEINVASSVNRLLEDRKSRVLGPDEMDTYSECIVTSLSASKGLLWIGTNRGFILTLPLPRLKDGVPLANGRPKISLHSHRGPVKFLIPIYYSSSVAELNRNSSLWSAVRMKRANRGDRTSDVFEPPKRDSSVGRVSPDIDENSNHSKTSTDTVASHEELNSDSGKVESDKDSGNVLSENNVDRVTSLEQKKTGTGQSQAEIWQAEIDRSVVEKMEKNGKTSVNVEAQKETVSDPDKTPVDGVESSVVGEKNPGAKTVECVRRRKSLRESNSFKREKPKRLSSKSKTLSFRSELANKIAKRNLDNSDSEYTEDEDDVRLLYENLLETDEDKSKESDEENFTDAISSFEELPKDLGSPENALSARKDSPTVKWDNTVRLPATASQSRQSLRGGSPPSYKTATLKKNPCNAVIVVCGGDGYCDWNKTKQKLTEDASLLLWIYKF